MGPTAPAATAPTPTSEPTGAVEQPSQSPSEPISSGEPPLQPPESGDGSPPAPILLPAIEAAVLPVLAPLPDLPGTDELPVPADASLPSQPDPNLPAADPLLPLPQVPLP
jgi:hypothetical protein